MRYITLSLLLIIGCFHAEAKDELNRKVTTSQDNYNLSFYISYQDTKISAKSDVVYYWFDSGRINQNVGGYSGHLLQGEYEKTTIGGSLIEQGTFYNGMKTGQWKLWDVSGNLIEVIQWKNGKRHGAFWRIDPATGKKISGRYKNDQYQGWIITSLNGSVTDKVKYRSGNVVEPKRFLIFNKKSLEPQIEQANDNSSSEAVEEED